jgi:hypothetical protein
MEGAMTPSDQPAYVIYRATSSRGRELEVHLAIAAEAATVQDAWSRLTRICPDVDPTSLEIEVRHEAAVPRCARAAGSR